jgi:predicted amidophosphoribosyltransferase
MAGRRECPSCASEIPASMDRCSICGYEFADKPPHRNWRLWVALLLLIVFLYPLIRMLLNALR